MHCVCRHWGHKTKCKKRIQVQNRSSLLVFKGTIKIKTVYTCIYTELCVHPWNVIRLHACAYFSAGVARTHSHIFPEKNWALASSRFASVKLCRFFCVRNFFPRIWLRTAMKCFGRVSNLWPSWKDQVPLTTWIILLMTMFPNAVVYKQLPTWSCLHEVAYTQLPTCIA